ncbi:MAG: ribonuclease III [Candidatus Fischerbacteria bacterium RBG_13_37_8]|uniref:Ribonuclease 3 n=1 Tax=Candidatus Fischerbacteria bacterium RBG_13_37_8 TaxID=1817863 RepID=A0A1F5VHY6_9BACT|nr:MAG: ribonuclease III [Candidatus Fischerbacteria bacterium RBG_13_37_8]
MKRLSALEKALHYKFKHKEHLKKAVTHSSYSAGAGNNNERLEFLGDAILNFVLSEFLYKEFLNYDEGTLSRIKAYIASEEFLYNISRLLDLGSYIYLGKGEDKTGGREKKSILSDAFEALIAAIYLDGGIKKVRKVILSLIARDIKDIDRKNADLRDFKSKLQEYFLSIQKTVPRYRLEKEYGPEHKKLFEISVWINDEKIGYGVGMSKKEAEQFAAQDAIINLKIP